MPTASRQVVVANRAGLHARPAMQLVDTANAYAAAVTVHKDAMDGEPAIDADAKSVMQVIMLAATEGTPLRIDADGDDAEAAVEQLAGLFAERFGEAE